MATADAGFRLRGIVDGREVVLVVVPGDSTVGSDPDACIAIATPTVSRRHALLRSTGSGLDVEDLGSKNGTFVNGQRVPRSPLVAGDRLGLGPVILTVEAAPADDCRLAVSLDRRASVPPGTARGAPTASEADASPGRFLAIAEALAVESRRGRQAALRLLVDRLGAGGAALVDVGGVDGRAVLAHSGAVSAGNLSAALADLALTATGADLATVLVGGDPPAALAVDPATGIGLAVTGSFPGWAGCLPVVRLALRLLEPPPGPGLPAAAPPTLGLRFADDHVVCRSQAMREVYQTVAALAASDLPVLLVGETGVGKEHVATALHLSSPRRGGPFRALNCAAIPADLLEAELFGIERGVATGVSERPGAFRLAAGGVLFLDEIGDMPLAMQAKLLRALQGREVLAVGAAAATRVDVRLVASTNQNLAELVERGAFRRDLYYRLAGAVVEVPPLRRRRDDIPDLAAHFLQRAADDSGRTVRGLTVAALDALVAAHWPGNVRQLEHEVRAMVLRCPPGQPVTLHQLPPSVLDAQPPAANPGPAGDLDLASHVGALEARLIRDALARTRGNRTAAAKLLGLTRNGLALKLARMGVGRPQIDVG